MMVLRRTAVTRGQSGKSSDQIIIGLVEHMRLVFSFRLYQSSVALFVALLSACAFDRMPAS